HQDFFPTIANLMGHPAGGELPLDGRDFLDPGTTPVAKAIIGWASNVSVRDAHWNLFIDYTGQTGRKELYDLDADPAESTNVYDQHPQVVAECMDFLQKTLGPLPYPIRHTGDGRQSPPLGFVFRAKA
ncbi:MAG TPA: hypothetical protein VM389_09295, partial [Phycisphaerae bacterium]|nr:hypothetical protein [Phycisphaerae bacterium]